MVGIYLTLAILFVTGGLVVALVSYHRYPAEQKIIRLTIINLFLAIIVIVVIISADELLFEKIILSFSFALIFVVTFRSIFQITVRGIQWPVVSEIMVGLAWCAIFLRIAL